MRILMLGWEFPPFITGGLGTACFGLTKALDRRDVEVTFVLPKAIEQTESSHVRLLTPEHLAQEVLDRAAGVMDSKTAPPKAASANQTPLSSDAHDGGAINAPSETSGSAGHPFTHLQFLEIPIIAKSSYAAPGGETTSTDTSRHASEASGEQIEVSEPRIREAIREVMREVLPEASDREVDSLIDIAAAARNEDYGDDLMSQVQRYAQFCLLFATQQAFDVIHAHDWLTFAAGLAIARMSGKPLVVHVHSTEFDRSGEHVNQQVYDIERRGMHGAMKIIAVSQLTKNTIVRRYGIHPEKVDVVYNGVDIAPTQGDNIGIRRRDRIVLYFGRITMQKGPEYFLSAAKRVIEHMDDVKFVVAGSGDMASRMIEMAASLGIGHKVLFTGFLRGRDIARVFALADLYVMPSVSEPFGIAPLEAMSHNVPVIISKSSGVSEVLTHALKVDFWDVDDMANKIVAVLRHPPLSRTLQEHGRFEVRRLTWDGAAERCEQVYRALMAHPVGAPTPALRR